MTDLTIIILLIVFIVSVILLKGFALYRAARKEDKGWFWVLLIFNTLGILPLLYLIFSGSVSDGGQNNE